MYSYYVLLDILFLKKIKFEIKGELKLLVIVVVSIIFWYVFVIYMDQILKNINMMIFKGVGVKVDVIVVKIIKKYGFLYLDIILKKYFKNCEKV